MVYYHEDEADERGFPAKAFAAWKAWYDSTPDTPCIAICSTSQGDALCKGCGRSFEEVQHWPEMTPAEKRQWRRITLQGDAWRFNRYAERAAEGAKPEGRGPAAAGAQAPNIAIASLWVDMLREAGVDACLKRYFLGRRGPAAARPVPARGVARRRDAGGRGARDAARDAAPPQRRWTCACGEEVEGGFASAGSAASRCRPSRRAVATSSEPARLPPRPTRRTAAGCRPGWSPAAASSARPARPAPATPRSGCARPPACPTG
jgi:predicted Fe-S protein YdhL (DUF1289 family)